MPRRLTLEETRNCLIAWRELQNDDALTLLTTCNRGLVFYFAQKYIGSGLTFDELVSAGDEGLVRAINKFNYMEYGVEIFSSYISTVIENSMRKEIRNYNKHSHVLSFNQPLGQNKDGDELTIEDIIGTDADELIDNVIDEMKIDTVREALQCLTSREKQIILLRYGLDEEHKKTQEEVAKILGCSIPTIVRQEQKALIKMRHPKNTRKIKDFLDN